MEDFGLIKCSHFVENFVFYIKFRFLGVSSTMLGFSRSSCLTDWLRKGVYDKEIMVPPGKPKKIKNPEIPVLKACNK